MPVMTLRSYRLQALESASVGRLLVMNHMNHGRCSHKYFEEQMKKVRNGTCDNVASEIGCALLGIFHLTTLQKAIHECRLFFGTSRCRWYN